MSTVILLGSTGQVGQKALLSALDSPAISSVHSIGRSPPANLSPSTPGYSKLSHTRVDFEALLGGDQSEAGKLSAVSADCVLVALGTTRGQVSSFSQFERIDKDYVLAAVSAARVEGKQQKIVYCSAGLASSTSRFPYLRSKGLTEEGLASLGYSHTSILRPAYLIPDGPRKEARLFDTLFSGAFLLATKCGLPVASPVETVGRMMVRVAVHPAEELAKEGWGRDEELNGVKVRTYDNGDCLTAAKNSF